MYEFDNAWGFVSLDVAKRLMNKSQPELIELAVDDIYAAPDVAAAIPRTLGDRYVTQDWTTMNRPLFEALWLEKMAISVTIGLIVMVAALNIVASLVLLVMEKNADIAILKTMGASARSVMYIFMLQGLIIGTIGTAVGGSAGVGISWVMNRYQLLRVPGMGEVYQISYVPFTLAAIRVCRRVRDSGAHLLRRHHLSIAPGGKAQADRSTPLRIGRRSSVRRVRAFRLGDGIALHSGQAATRKSLFPNKIAGTLLEMFPVQTRRCRTKRGEGR